MITCNRCRTTNPAGTAYCQRCGFALTNMGESGIHSGVGNRSENQGQPALPAWLESLRSGMGDAPFTSDNQRDNGAADLNNKPEQESIPPNFQAANLIDDESLPSWLRSNAEAGGGVPAGANRPDMPHSLRPASYKAPNTDENVFAGREKGIAANSLIDEQLLPPWMRQEQGASSQGNQHNIPASSLVQPDAMPDWMKNMQAPSTPSTSSISPSSPMNAPATDPFQAPSPISPQATPSMGQGFSARELIDPQALPPWMSQQNGQQAGQGETFSASSLLDGRALPNWMSEEEQRPGPTPAPVYPPTQTASTQAPSSLPPQAAQGQGSQANMAWQAQQPPAPGNNSQMAVGPNHTISASSFVDINSLPPWLRQDDGPSGTQQGSAQGGPQRPGQPGYPVPPSPRAESVRVPSRPRSEMAQSEGSEVAANVFASMLGVASTAPNFPQQAQSAAQGPQGFQGAQSDMPPMGNPPPAQGMAYGNVGSMGGMQGVQGWQVPPPQGFGAMPPQPPPGYMQGGYQNQGNYPMGNPAMMPPTNMGGQQPNAKPAKRGLFEAIRSWLFRS